jgi:hypothetical protein
LERAERTGVIVSAAGHTGLIALALVGGLFSHDDTQPATIATEVSLMSSEEFASLAAAAPRAEIAVPDAPSLPEAAGEAAPPPAPEAPPPRTETPEVAAPEPEPAPEAPEEVPEAEVADTPPEIVAPPVEEPSDVLLDTVAPRPEPRPAPRVAPVPTEAPEPEAEVSDTVTAAAEPVPAEEPEAVPEEEADAAAPPETGQVIETEENRDTEEIASSAPVSSPRPAARPERRPAAEPEQEPEPAAAAETAEAPSPAPEESAETDAATAAALAELVGGEASEEERAGTGTAASGPPITSGEREALIVAVKGCWNVGALSTDALRTIVTVGVTMSEDGKPDAGSVRMVSFEGGDETAARQAFEAGRRAILRCGRDGFPLPPEKYAQWREIEITFDPSTMRLR